MSYDASASTLALLIRAGAEHAELRPVRANDATTMQRLVGGWLEALDLAEDATMYFNEEGKILRLPVNASVTRLAAQRHGWMGTNDHVVGDVVVVGVMFTPEMGAVSADVPETVRDLCTAAGLDVVEFDTEG